MKPLKRLKYVKKIGQIVAEADCLTGDLGWVGLSDKRDSNPRPSAWEADAPSSFKSCRF